MNLLEHYIEEVHSIVPCTAEWTKELPEQNFLSVDVTYNCYGVIERTTRVFEIEEWDITQKRGYWMG